MSLLRKPTDHHCRCAMIAGFPESVQGVYIDPSREDAYLQPQVRGTRSCLGTCVLRDRGGGHQQDGYRREALHQIRKNREGESPIIFGWRGPRLVWVKGAFFGDSIGNKALQTNSHHLFFSNSIQSTIKVGEVWFSPKLLTKNR